jgi:hypothetical protein
VKVIKWYLLASPTKQPGVRRFLSMGQKLNSSYTHQPGSIVQLTCEATGSPAPNIRWFKNNAPIYEVRALKNSMDRKKHLLQFDGRYGVVVGILAYYARGRGFDSRVQTFACMKMSVCIGSRCLLYMYVFTKKYISMYLSVI